MQEALTVIRQLADAIAYLHDLGKMPQDSNEIQYSTFCGLYIHRLGQPGWELTVMNYHREHFKHHTEIINEQVS